MVASRDSESFDLIDPLAEFADKPLLFFFPRSFDSSSNSSTHISNLNSSISNASKGLNTHLQAMVFSSPDKLLEQVKTIRDEAVLPENGKVPRERRPGLGIKLPKFSLKPIPSQPASSLDFNVDFEKLTDPDDFFDAVKRMENAKREVAKLKGEPLMGFDLNRASSAPRPPRPRRPGILGRTYTYTHPPSSTFSVSVDDTLLNNQETYDNDILSPTRNDVLPDANVMNNSASVRLSDSKDATTSKVNMLDDQDKLQGLVISKLHIKRAVADKALPPFQFGEFLTSRSALLKRNNFVSHQSGAGESSRSRDQLTPGKSKSPLASISLLNRHIAKCIPSMDLFSPLHIDSSPVKAAGPSKEPKNRVDQAGQSDDVDARKNFHVSGRSPAHDEEDIANSVAKDVNPVSKSNESEDVIGQFNQIGNRMDSYEFGRSPVQEESFAVSNEGYPDFASNVVDAAVRKLIFEGPDRENTNSNGDEKEGTGEPSHTENITVEEPTKEMMGSSKRNLNKEKSKASSEAIVSEEAEKREARSKKRKMEGAKPGHSRGGRELRRFSLYSAGTNWKGGVRRSTRIRMKPLEFWRGERLLYGRVHESLVTVIGVKHAASSENAEPGLKVKSFVSDKYKDLVEFASLH